MLSSVRVGVRRRWAVLVGLVLASVGLAAAAIAVSGAPVTDGGEPVRVEAAIADWRWAPNGALPVERSEEAPPSDEIASAPAPEAPPAYDADADAPAEDPEPPAEPPKLPNPNDEILRGEVLDNGIALPQLDAAPELRASRQAGNNMACPPYE